jgi:hypothetical protein
MIRLRRLAKRYLPEVHNRLLGRHSSGSARRLVPGAPISGRVVVARAAWAIGANHAVAAMDRIQFNQGKG